MKTKYWLTAIGLAGISAVCFIVADVQLRYLDRIGGSPNHFNITPAAMVLGASVKNDGTPSDALRDRLDEAKRLYDNGATGKILITGDDGAYHADEIDVMKRYLQGTGVPEGDIMTDGHGYRTYESCKNAKAAGINRVIIITQRFHLGRALYLCNSMGIDSIGSAADKQTYKDIVYFWLRDLAASAEAWWDINIWPPKPPVERITQVGGIITETSEAKSPTNHLELYEPMSEVPAALNGTTTGTGASPVAEPVITIVQPQASTARTQYVLLAFDGSYSIPMWKETRAFAQKMRTEGKPVSFTYFVSGVYLLTNSASSTYEAPNHKPGESAIGFGGSKKMVADRIEQINLAIQEGHEIGSHANGHYTGATWTEDDWRKELNQFKDIITNTKTIDGLQNEPDSRSTINLPASGIAGFRAPELGTSAELFPVLKEVGYTYDASKGTKDGLWPGKTADGLWEFALPRITYNTSTSLILSMDYNFFFKQSGAKETLKKGTPEWDYAYNATLTSFNQSFDAHYAGTRAPFQIGNHFSAWNDGMYWEAMKAFAERVCGMPDVKCVTMSTMAGALDSDNKL
ncbi:MAG: ElyC/SanA/YdcF family protein [Patescibacteria group bacterium]